MAGLPPGQQAEAAQRTALIVERRRRGESFGSIGADLGMSKQRVHQIWKRELDKVPIEEIQTYRREQLARLDALLLVAWSVLERDHVIVSHGRVVYLDMEPLRDDGPVLAAIQTILRIEERRAKLLGLDTPVERRVTGNIDVRYVIEGVDMEALR